MNVELVRFWGLWVQDDHRRACCTGTVVKLYLIALSQDVTQPQWIQEKLDGAHER